MEEKLFFIFDYYVQIVRVVGAHNDTCKKEIVFIISQRKFNQINRI